MIHHVQGNLLTSDCRVIGHQSNCLMGFGSGIAGQIRVMYPEAYEAFKNDTRTPEEKLGLYSWTHCSDKGYGEKVIYNLYGQYYYGGKDPKGFDTDYEALGHALNRMVYNVGLKFGKSTKIGLPYLIGCGLAGGDWNVVSGIIEKVSNLNKHDIWLYEYTP